MDWLPDDATWERYTVPILKKQCDVRKLLVSGTKEHLVQRLNDYQKAHCTEKRLRPWVVSPAGTTYECVLETTRLHKLRVVQVKNFSDYSKGRLTMHFIVAYLYSEGKVSTQTVMFANTPSCDCPEFHSGGSPACVHITCE